MASLEHLKGSSVTLAVTTDSVEYKGIIHAVDEKARKLVLKKVVDSAGVKYNGNQVFYADAIKDLTVHERPDKKQSVGKGEDEQISSKEGIRGSDQECIQTLLNPKEKEEGSAEALKDFSDEGFRLLEPPHRDPLSYLAGSYAEADQRELVTSGKPPPYHLINSFDEAFTAAIANVRNHRVVGLSAEGANLCRLGSLSLLVIGCVDAVYVFDVLQLGGNCFSEDRLKAILESRSILKVMHDCRRLSDYLFHVQGISLRNVFDTQVADVIVYKQTRGELPCHLGGLLSSLNDHLGMDPDSTEFRGLLTGHGLRTRTLWAERPLSEEVLKAAVEQVIYLRELRNVLIERMLMEFLHGVDLYLMHMRDAPATMVGSKMDGKLPKGFTKLGTLEKHRKGRYVLSDKQRLQRSLLPQSMQRSKPAAHKPMRDLPKWVEKRDFVSEYDLIHGRVVEVINDNDDYDSHSSHEYLSDEQTINLADKLTSNEQVCSHNLPGKRQSETPNADSYRSEALLQGDNSAVSESLRTFGRVEETEDLDFDEFKRTLRLNNAALPGRLTASPNSGSVSLESGEESDRSKGELVQARETNGNTKSSKGHDRQCLADSLENSRLKGQEGRSSPLRERKDKRLTRTQRGLKTRSNDTADDDYIGHSPAYRNLVAASSPQKGIFNESDFSALQEVQSKLDEQEVQKSISSATYSPKGSTSPKVGLASMKSAIGAKVHGRGRARTRDFYLQNPVNTVGGALPHEISKDLSAVSFPTDDELLRTPLVAEAAGPVYGQAVNLKRVVDD